MRKSKQHPSALIEAYGLIHGERQKVYSHPLDDFGRTAKIWSGILGIEVTAEQVALCMCGVKISRLISTPGHRDSIVDLAGYAGCYEMVVEERKKRGL
jgi:hypothetical protein